MRLLVPAAAAFASLAVSSATACPWHRDRAAQAAQAAPAPPTDEEVALAPPSAAPVMTPAMTPAESDQGWCHRRGTWKHAKWWRNYEPRFGVGYAKGHLEMRDTDDEVTQKSLIGRVVLRRGFEIELELSKIEDGGETTHTHGAALVKTFGRHHLRPYVVAGFGGGSITRADGSEPSLRYGELGLGLVLRGRHLAVAVDYRKGVRELDGDTMGDAVGRMATSSDGDDKEHYARGRVMAFLYF